MSFDDCRHREVICTSISWYISLPALPKKAPSQEATRADGGNRLKLAVVRKLGADQWLRVTA
jgi:hypothetical protein